MLAAHPGFKTPCLPLLHRSVADGQEAPIFMMISLPEMLPGYKAFIVVLDVKLEYQAD